MCFDAKGGSNPQSYFKMNTMQIFIKFCIIKFGNTFKNFEKKITCHIEI